MAAAVLVLLAVFTVTTGEIIRGKNYPAMSSVASTAIFACLTRRINDEKFDYLFNNSR